MVGNNYTLPLFNFNTNDKTKLYIENAYNPLINNQIRNNFELKDNNMNIITGANLTGKTTYIQSIALNVLFAQTFGICPCTKIICKPFTKIILSVNIKDKIFMNQINKYHEIIKNIEENEDNIFIAIDDLFYGCSPYETFALTNAYINYLANYDNLIGIIATQYSYISKNKLVQYNKFDTEYNKITNSFKYDYKLKEGISQQNVLLQLLTERGWNDMIINDASKLL
jgi:DNA mismatch repair ATPase MutS